MFFSLDCSEPCFFKTFGFEALPSEPCLNGHNHQHIDLIEIRLCDIEINVGIDYDSTLFAFGFDCVYRTLNVFGRIGMEGNNIRARIAKLSDVLFGLGDHEMRVDRHIRVASERLDHWHAERDIRHVHAVHNVAMHDIRAPFFYVFYLACHIAEIGGKH